MLPPFINLTPVQLNPALISVTLCGNIRVQSESEDATETRTDRKLLAPPSM